MVESVEWKMKNENLEQLKKWLNLILSKSISSYTAWHKKLFDGDALINLFSNLAFKIVIDIYKLHLVEMLKDSATSHYTSYHSRV